MNLAIAVEKCQTHCRYDTLSYYPRSIHTHFQGLCVVFALLISIPSGRLTEHCCSHLLWLCDTVESGLVPRFVISLDYIYIIPQLCGFVKGYLQSFSKKLPKFQSVRTYCLIVSDALGILRILDLLLIPLTPILYHNFLFLSSTFSKIIKKFFIGLCEIFNNLRPGRLGPGMARFSPPGPTRAPSESGRKKRDIFYPSTLASSQAIVFELVARNLIFFSCLPLSIPSRPNSLTKASNSFLFIWYSVTTSSIFTI